MGKSERRRGAASRTPGQRSSPAKTKNGKRKGAGDVSAKQAENAVLSSKKMKIEYDGSIPTSFLKIIKPRIEFVSEFFPSWCEKLFVFFDKNKEEAEDTILTCNPRYEYRCMSVTVHPLFVEDSENWENSLLHEIQHGLFRPYTAKVDRIVAKFVKDETVIDYINEELAEAEECVAEDLAIFSQKLAEYYSKANKPKT